MDIIIGILAIIAILIAIAAGGAVLWFLLCFGITIVGWYFVPDLWRAGHDNLAILLAIGAPIINVFAVSWLSDKIDSGRSGPYPYFDKSSKKTIYDKDGNVKGYEDR